MFLDLDNDFGFDDLSLNSIDTDVRFLRSLDA